MLLFTLNQLALLPLINLYFVLDLVQTIGYFNYVNRIVAGLDVKLGVGEGAPGSL